MRQAETTGRCLTQASTSKLNLLFFFLCQMPQSIRVEKELRLLFPIFPQSTESGGVGLWPLAKTEKSFIFFLH